MAVTLGKAIKIIREANGKSLAVLSREANISIPYLSLLEGDKRNPSLDVINRLAEALGVPPHIFLLIGSGSNTSLSSSNDMTSRLIAMLRQMEIFEIRIKNAVEQQGS